MNFYTRITGASSQRYYNLDLRSSSPPDAQAPSSSAATTTTTDDVRKTSRYNYYSQAALPRRIPAGRRMVAEHGGRQVRRRRDETASERERTRARQLNDAFDRLRRVVPSPAHDERRRLSKIATLRLAINYLGALMTVLDHRQASPLSVDHLGDIGTVTGQHVCTSAHSNVTDITYMPVILRHS